MKAILLALLVKFPYIRVKVKGLYLAIARLLSQIKNRGYNNPGERPFAGWLYESFIGYYTNLPARDGKLLMMCRETAMSESKLCVVDEERSLLWLSGDLAISKQMGCRAIWVSKQEVVFNRLVDGEPKAFVADIVKGAVSQVFKNPVLEASDSVIVFGNCANYKDNAEDYFFGGTPERSQPTLTFVTKGSGKTIFELTNDITESQSLSLTGSWMHPILSPNSGKCLLIFRDVKKSQRLDRLFIVDLVNLQIDEPYPEGLYSHFCWISDDEVLGYFLYQGKLGYWIINLTAQEITAFMHKELRNCGDGHPTFNGHQLIIDTYPNVWRRQKLIRIDFSSREILNSLDFFSPPEFVGVNRCDLHPRIDSCGTIYVDSIQDGVRQVTIIPRNR